MLNDTFSRFDALTDRFGLEEIKTIGDAYMVAGGLPGDRPDHADAVANMALAMQQEIRRISRENNRTLKLRIGIHTGPVVAGVIGTARFSYDLRGDTVNIASRMEFQGIADEIQVTESTWRILKSGYAFESRGPVDIRGRGPMVTWLLKRKLD